MIRNILLCLCFGLVLTACREGNRKQAANADTQQGAQDLPLVTVMTVQRGVFFRELQSNGHLSALHKADLYFRSAELISSISVRNGQRVSTGQEIARIEEFELRNNLLTATEAVETSLMKLNDFLIGYRYELKDTATVPPAILKAGYSQAQLLGARVALSQAEYNLRHASLRSPIAVVVANISTKEHNIAPTAEAFCTIIGDASFEVEFPVLESEIELLNAGHEVQIEPLAYPGTKIKGNLDGMNPVVDKNGMVKAKAVVNNTQGKLYEGMNVRVLVQQSVPDKLVVPKSAVVLRSDRQVLFVYKEGRSQWRYVETGLENSREYTIEKELEAGEQVIVRGNFNLAHDVPLTIDQESEKW